MYIIILFFFSLHNSERKAVTELEMLTFYSQGTWSWGESPHHVWASGFAQSQSLGQRFLLMWKRSVFNGPVWRENVPWESVLGGLLGVGGGGMGGALLTLAGDDSSHSNGSSIPCCSRTAQTQLSAPLLLSHPGLSLPSFTLSLSQSHTRTSTLGLLIWWQSCFGNLTF